MAVLPTIRWGYWSIERENFGLVNVHLHRTSGRETGIDEMALS
jgi:hypothetical protein